MFNNNKKIFVIKKNVAVLKKVIDWLEQPSEEERSKYSVLVIDDEADQASINTKQKKGGISKTNERIRAMLRKFEKVAYIGYTATPFANVLIPETTSETLGGDLFPSDFILNIPPPSKIGRAHV